MLASSIFLLLSAQSAVIDARPYPTIKPGPVLQSPDWSDYHIYPKSAANQDHEGRVKAETLVGRDGVPKACRILESSSFADLDDGTCALFMEMRFVPAHDASGNAVESRFANAVNWHLADPLPWGSTAIRLTGRVKDGRIAQCRPEAGEGPYLRLWALGGCSYLADVSYFFGAHANEDASFRAEFRLDAGDGAPVLQTPWTAGVPIAHEKVAFTVAPTGDPANCAALESAGFGRRGMRSLSPCGPMLAVLYFQTLLRNASMPAQRGTVETRVYLDKSSD